MAARPALTGTPAHRPRPSFPARALLALSSAARPTLSRRSSTSSSRLNAKLSHTRSASASLRRCASSAPPEEVVVVEEEEGEGSHGSNEGDDSKAATSLLSCELSSLKPVSLRE